VWRAKVRFETANRHQTAVHDMRETNLEEREEGEEV